MLVFTQTQKQFFYELAKEDFKKKIIHDLRSLDNNASDEILGESADSAFSFCAKVNLTNRDSILGCAILIHFYGLIFFKTDNRARTIADHTKPEALRKTVIHNMLTCLRKDKHDK